MPSWKKLIQSGSNAELNQITASGNIISSGNISTTGIISSSNAVTCSAVHIHTTGAPGNKKLLRILEDDVEKFYVDEDGDIQNDGTINTGGVIKSGEQVHVDISGAQTDSLIYLEKQGTSAEQYYVLIEEEGTEIFSIKGEGDGATANVMDLSGANSMAITGIRYLATHDASSYVDIQGTAAATNASGDTGALRVEGGGSIAKNLFVGTSLIQPGGGAGHFFSSSNGNIEISGSGTALLEVHGNISGSATSTGSFGYIIGNGAGITNVSATPPAGTISSSLQIFSAFTSSGNISGSATSDITVGGTGSFGHIKMNGTGKNIYLGNDSYITFDTTTTITDTHIKGGENYLNLDGDDYVTAEADIRFKSTAPNNQFTGHITASGNISASGGTSFIDVGGGGYKMQGVGMLNRDDNELILGPDSTWTAIEIGQVGAQTKNISLYGPVTASGNISASGNIIGTTGAFYGNIDATGDATFGTITMTGKIDTAGEVEAEHIHSTDDIEVGDDIELTSGNARILNTSAQAGLLFGTANSGILSITSGSSVTVPFYFDTKNKRLGINELDPGHSLTVMGDVSSSGNFIGRRRFNTSNTVNNNLAQGDIIYQGGGSTTQGNIVYMKTDGEWGNALANAASTSTSLLGIALGTDPDVDGVLLRGTYTLDHDVGNNQGVPLYLSDADAGQATVTAPSDDGDIIRIIGYNLGDDDEIWFDPDKTWVKVS